MKGLDNGLLKIGKTPRYGKKCSNQREARNTLKTSDSELLEIGEPLKYGKKCSNVDAQYILKTGKPSANSGKSQSTENECLQVEANGQSNCGKTQFIWQNKSSRGLVEVVTTKLFSLSQLRRPVHHVEHFQLEPECFHIQTSSSLTLINVKFTLTKSIPQSMTNTSVGKLESVRRFFSKSLTQLTVLLSLVPRKHGQFDERRSQLPREQRPLTQILESIAGELMSITPTIKKLKAVLKGPITQKVLTKPEQYPELKAMVVKR